LKESAKVDIITSFEIGVLGSVASLAQKVRGGRYSYKSNIKKN
jgi:hypothetical protein